MRFLPKARVGLLAVAVLLAGCSTTVDGRPVASPRGPDSHGPGEPAFPTPRPSMIPPPAGTSTPVALPPTNPGPSPNPAPGAIPLKPDDNGYVFIETKSGMTRCQINKDSVGCEAPFTNSPMQDGEHTNGIHITSAGNVQWILGNLGAIPTVQIDYKTYDAQGWTIVATKDGTRFENNATKHGMFVSIDKVDTF
ncbi:hypothetical protein [Mycobacterium vicinigordonae]|uniref:Lipoprotein LpqJ n=1 Tax=Mycobacterium vicinigordonae TaxID=1719132 RepID=A0A7D6I6C5_9MYCO|nr:hypothetical protein [Mycobacterium vicinigordonae]QLL08038.1 hypothetical protein H0P51_03355 [Mycobacterium vicinigordonae]